MTLDPEDLAWVRTFVTWDPPADGDLDARYDALYSAHLVEPGFDGETDPHVLRHRIRARVAEWYVRARLSAMIDDPESFSIAGEYSESWGANIQALRESLRAIQANGAGATAGGGGFAVGRATRAGSSQFR